MKYFGMRKKLERRIFSFIIETRLDFQKSKTDQIKHFTMNLVRECDNLFSVVAVKSPIELRARAFPAQIT